MISLIGMPLTLALSVKFKSISPYRLNARHASILKYIVNIVKCIMDIAVKTLETDTGKPCILVDGYLFRLSFICKDGSKNWRCCAGRQSCKATLKTDGAAKTVIVGNMIHSHDADARAVERKMLRAAVKRKAVESISEKPLKILRTELLGSPANSLQKQDIGLLRQAMYRQRRTLFPAVPKSRPEVFQVLSDLSVKTNKNEPFLLATDEPNNIVVFGCVTNLEFLCNSTEEIFADGTFKCAPKHSTDVYHSWFRERAIHASTVCSAARQVQSYVQ